MIFVLFIGWKTQGFTESVRRGILRRCACSLRIYPLTPNTKCATADATTCALRICFSQSCMKII
jgi:hypothetical protein